MPLDLERVGERGDTQGGSQALRPRLSFEAGFESYLAIAEELEGCWEWIAGELVEVPPESEPNITRAQALFLKLVAAGIPFRLIKTHCCQLEVPVLHPKDARNRFPDLVILREEHLALTQASLCIRLEMPPPRLIAEIVSPGRVGYERDYERKRAQYAQLGVDEYWLVDPERRVVVVLGLNGSAGNYEELGQFQGEARVQSRLFPTLDLKASEVILADL